MLEIEIESVVRCPLSLASWSCSLPTGCISKQIRLSIPKRQWNLCESFSLHSRMVKGNGTWLDACGKWHKWISHFHFGDPKVNSDLTQILGCLSDHRSNPQLKRRRETEILEPPVSQIQRDYHASLWEQTSFAGGSLQRQIAAAKLEPPALMQTPYAPTNNWDIHNSLGPQLAQPQPSHPLPSFSMTSHDNSFSRPVPQNSDTAPFFADPNFQPSLSAVQATQSPDLGINFSNELIELWANLPLSFGCVLSKLIASSDAVTPGSY